jgi:hypothetical protein
MKPLSYFLAEAKKKSIIHTLNVNYHSDHVDREELEGHADTEEGGHGTDMTTGREDVQFDYKHKQHAMAAKKRIEKRWGKHVKVSHSSWDENEEI